jgi:hypothetical protein
MDIRDIVNEIHKIKINYNEPGQAVDIAKALDALSSDLYTDSKRFIYELLQNADDAVVDDSKNQIAIRFFNGYMVFAHNGKEFSKRDIEGLCAVSHGTKRNDKTKTGYKGIGFKSVFGQSNQVIIYTNGEYFKFDKNFDFKWNLDWAKTQEDWEQNCDRDFAWPWQIIPIYTEQEFIDKDIKEYLDNKNFKVATVLKLDHIDNVKNELEELLKSLNMFIFLRHIDKLSIFIDKEVVIEVEHFSDNEIILKKDQKVVSSWLLKKIDLELNETIKTKIKNDQNIPNKLKETDSIELLLCAKKTRSGIQKVHEEDSLLFSYLPTSVKTNIPVLVNSSFIMGANRQDLHIDSPINQWLFYNISYQLIKWIGELVITEYSSQAYRLLPDKLNLAYELNNEYEEGKHKAINDIPLLISEKGKLLRVKDAIFDEVGLSKETFVSKDVIKNFVFERNSITVIDDYNPFIKKTEFEDIFFQLGLMKFSWAEFSSFLTYKDFLDGHNIEDNIELIRFLKEVKKPENIKNKTLKNWAFIFNHHDLLKTPDEIFIPIIGDDKWKDDKDISYLHGDIQEYILENNDYKTWLEKLGVKEKTDVAYLEKHILPKIDEYATEENTFVEMKKFFDMFTKGKLSDDIMNKLSNIDVLTSKNKLLKVSKCYFPDIFNPELKLEGILDKDIFLNEKYLFDNSDKDKVKDFFKKLGVKQKISILNKKEKTNKNELTILKTEYFNTEDKKFQPFQSIFTVDEYSNLITFKYINYTFEYEFAKVFWGYIIQEYKVDEINKNPIGYWGHSGRNGRIYGDEVQNYIKWFIQHDECLPTQLKECYKSKDIFLNSDSILEIAEGYLPIIDLDNISSDWKSFFNFKTILDLDDYKELYKNIFLDINDNKIKSKDMPKVQKIYKFFLDDFENGDDKIQRKFKRWIKRQKISNKDLNCFDFNDIKYTDEDDTTIFSDSYNFIYFNQKNKSHQNFYKFLEFLEVDVLTDKDFEIKKIGEPRVSSLKNKLLQILPALLNWIKYLDSFFDEDKEDILKEKIDKLYVYEYDKLETPVKNIKVYFEDEIMNLSKSWTSKVIQLELFSKLVQYLDLIGYENKLSFLLLSDVSEIKEYFEEEGISVPDDLEENISTNEYSDSTSSSNGSTKIDKTEITKDILVSLGIDTEHKLLEALQNQKIADEFYHNSVNSLELLEHAHKIIARAGKNILEYLCSLDDYDCDDAEFISSTIIGGIKKYGHEINIIARPSDNGMVILYYDAEFDTLENADSELWCENGKDEPKIIRLGKVLKDTKINRIPV